MKIYPPGEDYAQIQYEYNCYHSNGEIETDGDWSAAYTLSDKLQDAEIAPKSILVLGCRTGCECSVLESDFEVPVVGLDIVPEFVQQAAARVPATVADMHRLPFADQSFDATVAVGTLEHCYDPSAALAEMARVTQRHVYFTADLEPDRNKFGSHYAFSVDPNEWLTLARNVGLSPIRTTIEQGSFHSGIHALARKRA